MRKTKNWLKKTRSCEYLLFNPNIEDSVQLDTTKFDFAITPEELLKTVIQVRIII